MARKKRAQRVDHGLHDVVVDRRQPERYWHSSEGLGNPSSEAYVGSGCDLHVHFRAGLVEGGIAGDWCAAFNRMPKVLDVVGCEVVGNEQTRARLREEHDIGQTVLVLDVKPVKLPKVVVAEPIPSLVRLQILDDFLRAFVDPPEHAFRFARILLLKDREAGIAFHASGNTATVVDEGEFQGEIIEGSPEIVDAIPDD